MERSSRTQMWTPFLTKKGFHTSSRLRTHLNKMELLRGRAGHSSKWQERCLMNTRRQSTFGQKRLRQLVMQQIACIFTSYSARRHTSSSPVTKPQVGYFRVFGSKCYILDKHHRSKFSPKSHEGFLLGYGSNSHTYRVYNNFTRKVEETVVVKFDESNGSQVEQLPIDVGDKDPSEAIQDLSIGKFRPIEVKESTSAVQVEASTSRQGEPRIDTEASTSGTHQDEENEEVHQECQQPPSPPQQENDNANNEEGQEEEQDEEYVQPRPKQKLSRVRARIAKDHPVEQIYNDIQTGRITRSKSRLAKFCENYSFISSIEPMKVEEALEDPDWINAMHEELHKFERNQVWTLVEKPDNNHNIIGTKWVFRIMQDEDGQVVHNKARLVAQGYTQSKLWTMVRHMLPLLDLSPFASYLPMLITMISPCTKWTLKVVF